ncbi:MAG TPA: 4Fe-4S binding protein [Prolixibacteraceae bacterium]|jgi:NAD-dependent dihydropyrimidine dehydrogenase PreA subunit
MIREIVNIDEDKCNGCGICIPNCHEGALQMIDGKARLISELMCDGLGACLGHCPEGAITIEKREADEYDEVLVVQQMIPKGKNTMIAHLKHLKEHGEFVFLKQAVGYLKMHASEIPFSVESVISEVHAVRVEVPGGNHPGGCPGSQAVSFEPQSLRFAPAAAAVEAPSALRQWPVQMHLINPAGITFQGTDLLLAADCVAFSLGNFHSKHLAGKSLVIACPKLDQGKEIYVEKIRRLIDEARVNTITVMMMEVPCCGGLSQLVRMASSQASRKVPVKEIIVSIKGEILSENWV